MHGGAYSACSAKDDIGLAQAVFHGRVLFSSFDAFLTGSPNTIMAVPWGIVSCLNLVVSTYVPHAPLRSVSGGCNRSIRYRACLLIYTKIALACDRVTIIMWAVDAAASTHSVVIASIYFF